MKREIAAVLLSSLLAGAAFGEPIQTRELAPPAAASDSDALKSLIEQSLAPPTKTQPDAQDPEADWGVLTADLWMNGIPEMPEPSPDALARNFLRYPGARPVPKKDPTLPTRFELSRGNLTANVAANVTTAAPPPSVIPVDTYAGTIPESGAGAFVGRVEYDLEKWQLYGGTSPSLAAGPNGTVGFANNVSGGTYYNLPASVYGGKIGTGFEVNPVGDAKTRLEYRQNFGATEGFLTAERSTPFQGLEFTPVHGVRAGINRKF